MTLAHDPGGKRLFDLPKGMRGDARFAGDRGQYRLWLSRQWTPHPIRTFALWIGMNPSTARADKNDPTVVREINFTMRWRMSAYMKCNVMDYRATFPADLLAPGVVPCSPDNLSTIRAWAKQAEKIICAWGSLHPSLVHHAVVVEHALRDDGHQLWCLGHTKNGGPKHPVRLANDTPLVPFEEVPV